MKSEIKGIVHGDWIELHEALGLPDGHEVTITVEPTSEVSAQVLAPGDGIRQSAGGWSDDPDGLDEWLVWTRQQRKAGRRPLEP